MDEKNIIASQAAGSFFIGKNDGSSNYFIEIEAVPGVRGMQPRIAISYSSGKTEEASFIAPGWSIDGFPRAVSDGSGKYFEDDSLLIAQPSSDGQLTSFDHEGNVTRYERLGEKTSEFEEFIAVQSEDAYGNCIKYTYDNQSRPVAIEYGTSTDQYASIDFIYSKTANGSLSQIVTKRDGTPVTIYDIVYQNDTVRSIQVSATDAKDSSKLISKNPIKFVWGSTTATKFMLVEMTEASGLSYKVEYQDTSGELGVVKTSSTLVQGLAGKVSSYDMVVNADDFVYSKSGVRHAKNVVIWDKAGKSGEYYNYDVSKDGTVVLLEAGLICNATEAGSGESTNTIAVSGVTAGKTSNQVITSKKTNEYITHKIGIPLVSRVVSETYFEGKVIDTATTVHTYDDEGNIHEVNKGDTTAVYALEKGPTTGNPHVRLPKRFSVYDTSDGRTVSKDKVLLKDEKYDYEFDKNGAVRTVAQQSLIEGTTYSNSKVSELGDHGFPIRHVAHNGTTIDYAYSKDLGETRMTFKSADGKHSLTETTISELRHGQPVRSVNAQGNVTAQEFNAFGEVSAVFGFDPGAPLDWCNKDEEKLICLTRTEKGFDKLLGLHCLKTTNVARKSGYIFESRTYMDQLFRPVIEAMQLDKKTWQVVCHGYSSGSARNKTTIPLELKASRKNFSAEFKSLKKSKLMWLETLYDDYGRAEEEKKPDGSVVKRSRELQENDQVEETTTILAKNGDLVSLSSEMSNMKGVVESLNQFDSKPTTYSYDVLGRITEKVDPLGQRCTYKWNAQDVCVEESDPITGLSSCQSDPTLLVSREVKNGEIFETDFDWLGRPTDITHTNLDGKKQTYSIAYLEDAENRSTSQLLTHPDGWQTALRYAPGGQEIERTLVLGKDYTETVKSSLRSDGLVAARHYPCNRSVQFDYDGRGATQNIFWGDTNKPIALFDGHDSYGRPIVTRFGNGVTEYRNYDPFGNLSNFTVANSVRENLTPYISLGYATDGSLSTRNLATATRVDGEIVSKNAYVYDERGKLSSDFSSARGGLRDYNFGASENLQSVVMDKKTTAFETNASGYQVTKVMGETALETTFDKHGDIRTLKSGSDIIEFMFDPFGNLSGTSSGSDKKASNVEFVTDLFGERFIKASPDGTVQIDVSPDYSITRKPDGTLLRTVKATSVFGVFAEFTIAEDKQTDKSLFKEFKTSAPSSPASIPKQLQGQGIIEAGDVYIHLDDLGSSLAATDNKGLKTAVILFDTYGEIDAEKSVGTFNFTVTFAGMRLDAETGLYFAGTRYYSTQLRRFISPDLIKASTDPYGYPSDPINFFDYEGACQKCRNYTSDRFQHNMGRKLKGRAVVFSMLLAGLFTIPVALAFFDSGNTSLSQTQYAFAWATANFLWFGLLKLGQVLFWWLVKRRPNCVKRICLCNRQLNDAQYKHRTLYRAFPVTLCLVGTLVGVTNMPFMLNLVAGEINDIDVLAARGAFAGFAADFAGVLYWLCFFDLISFFKNSIIMKSLSHSVLIFMIMMTYHIADAAIICGAYRALSVAELFYLKREFIIMEALMVPFMGVPSIFWSCLPAICCSEEGDFWGFFFKKDRERFDNNRPIPICCCKEPRAPSPTVVTTGAAATTTPATRTTMLTAGIASAAGSNNTASGNNTAENKQDNDPDDDDEKQELTSLRTELVSLESNTATAVENSVIDVKDARIFGVSKYAEVLTVIKDESDNQIPDDGDQGGSYVD
ncbi:MAG: RHS repeat-associated core domain-containing protein [Proteobacteria bacterium]|nr:RHS repeat-associated core domain-containing protein [Pseudomonadota bacterium]